MPRQHVDRPAFASDQERRLRGALPAERNQDLDEPLHHGGVSGVQKPIQLLAAPPNPKIQLRAQAGDYLLHRVKRRLIEPAAFQPRHCRLRHAAPQGEIRLPPAQSMSQRPDRSTELPPIHRCNVRVPALPRPNRACPLRRGSNRGSFEADRLEHYGWACPASGPGLWRPAGLSPAPASAPGSGPCGGGRACGRCRSGRARSRSASTRATPVALAAPTPGPRPRGTPAVS